MEFDVTDECDIEIVRYSRDYSGIEVAHDGNKLLIVKLKTSSSDINYARLWDINKGYNILLDRHGNFKVMYDSLKSKICSECGQLKV